MIHQKAMARRLHSGEKEVARVALLAWLREEQSEVLPPLSLQPLLLLLWSYAVQKGRFLEMPPVHHQPPRNQRHWE